MRSHPEEWKIRRQKGSTLVADLLTKPTTQIAAWRRFWKALSFLVSEKHEDALNDEKGTIYENEEKASDSKADSGNYVEAAGSTSVSQEAVVKIAKVGLLLGLVEKIPWNPEHCSVKAVLLIVFTVLLSFFVWQWKRNNDFSIGMVSKGCCKLRVSPSMVWELGEKKHEKKDQEEKDKRVRESEPTPQNWRDGVREHEPAPPSWKDNEEKDETRKDTKGPLEKEPQNSPNFRSFLGTPGSRGERVETAVFGTDQCGRASNLFCLRGLFL